MNEYQVRRANLLKLIQGSFLSHKEMAAKIGTSSSYVTQILSDNINKPMGHPLARKIEEAFNLARGWMDIDHSFDEPINKKSTTGEKTAYYHPGIGQIITVPILRSSEEVLAWLKNPILTIQHEILPMIKKETLDIGANAFVHLVVDSSLIHPDAPDKSLQKGDLIVINTTKKPEDGHKVIAKFGIDDLRLRVYCKDGTDAYLKTYDPSVSTISMQDGNVQILGVMVGGYREIGI